MGTTLGMYISQQTHSYTPLSPAVTAFYLFTYPLSHTPEDTPSHTSIPPLPHTLPLSPPPPRRDSFL